MKEFRLPDLGEGVHEGQVLRVMVKPGEAVREDQPLMEVETDKAAVVIPCPFTGIVQKVHVSEGQLVHVGDVMVTFGEGGADQPRESQASGRAASAAPITARQALQPPAKGIESATATRTSTAAAAARLRKPASPAVRKLARAHGIDIETIHGSGPGGRVQCADVETAATVSRLPLGEGSGMRAAAASEPRRMMPFVPSPQPSPRGRGSQAPPVAARVAYPPLPESPVVEPAGTDDQDQYGPIKRAPLTQTRKTIAGVMAQSWSTIPHATDFDDADVTELDHLRRGYAPPEGSAGRKLTLLAFVIRAVVRALQRFPEFNAAIDLDRHEVIYKRYINIAVGVHTERGLVPMVIRDADRMTIPQISDELHVVGEKARGGVGGFAVNDTRGGTYTISNAGAMGGSRYSTPIITPPQVAVLALGRTRWMPWVVEHENAPPQRGLSPRLIMPLSHSIDHRLLDGGQEVQFMQHVIADLQNPARLLL